MFNPQRYHKRIKESRRRLEITRRFEEPDRVPILFSTGGSSMPGSLDIISR